MWTPWIAGSAPLYTREFWQSCLDRLNEHGMMVTWTFGAQTDEQAFKILLKTFQSIFGHTTVLLTPQGPYVLLLGSRDPIRVDSERISGRLAGRSPNAFPTFIPDERTFLAAFVAGEEQVRKYVDGSPVAVNTLERPALRYPFPWSSVPERTALDGIKELRAEEGHRPWVSSGPRNQ
jgi:spermidine synthase